MKVGIFRVHSIRSFDFFSKEIPNTLQRLSISLLTLFLFSISKAYCQVAINHEQLALDEISKSNLGLKSWKSSGILTQEVSEEFKTKVQRDTQIISKRSGDSKNRHTNTVYSFDHPTQFITAQKGDVTLYAERKITDGNDSDTIKLPANDKTLALIKHEGTCSVTKGDVSFDLIGDAKINSRRDLARKQPLPVATQGSQVEEIYATPAEAITKLGFRFVREEKCPVFNKVYVFAGNIPNSPYQLTFDVAPEFGYKVVHSVMQSKENVKLKEFRMLSLQKIGNYWFPEKSQGTLYLPVLSSAPSLTKNYRFYNITVNDVTDEFLGVKLNPGDYKWDEKTNSTWKAGPNGEMIYQDESGKNSPKHMWPGWLYMASVTSLLVLTVGAYVKWKRKQLSKQA